MATKKPKYTVESWPRDDASLGEMLSTEEVTSFLGITEDELIQLRDGWKVVGVAAENGTELISYPSSQFDDNGIHPSVEAVVAKMCTRMGPRTIAAVLNTRTSTTGEGTHWDMLHGNPEDLMVSWAAAIVQDYNHAEPETY